MTTHTPAHASTRPARRPAHRSGRRRGRTWAAVAAAVITALGSVALPSIARADAQCQVADNFTLQLGDSITSCGSAAYKLILQGDGNLVLTPTASYGPLWATGTNGQGVTRAVMQGDGNLVLYAGDTAKWGTGTSDATGALLRVQDDGNLVIYRGDTVVWDRYTGSSVNTKPDFGNCEPAFVVENYGGIEGSLGAVSAGHCASQDAVTFALGGDHDFEITPLDVNRLNAPTVAGGGELRSANWFKWNLLDAESFVQGDRTDMVNPTAIGAVNNDVCHFGGVSRRACGHIVRDDYQPSYIQGSRDFYLLDIPCVKGDSGSAVISADGTRAVGIVSGRRKSDGACIVARLDRVFPGQMKLYQPPALDAKYSLLMLDHGKWISAAGAITSRAGCVDLIEKGGYKGVELRCVPM